jgi:hypothetical protein
MANSSGFREHAFPTARTAVGEPIRLAIAAKVVVLPKGIFKTSFQTLRWNGVPRMSSGRARVVLGLSINEMTALRAGRVWCGRNPAREKRLRSVATRDLVIPLLDNDCGQAVVTRCNKNGAD